MKKLLRYLMIAASLSLPVSAFAVGAIAVADEEGTAAKDVGYGFVTGEDTKEAAQRKALKECKAAGNDDCKIAVWFQQCGAYVATKKHSGWGYGKTKAAAISMAKEKCGDDCKVVVAECED